MSNSTEMISQIIFQVSDQTKHEQLSLASHWIKRFAEEVVVYRGHVVLRGGVEF